MIVLFGCSSPIEKVTNGKSCTDCDLRGADLSGLTLRNIDLSNSDLSNANLSNTVFENVNLANANLNNADLINIKTTYFDDDIEDILIEHNIRQNKIQTSFFKADLSGANLSESIFEYTFFDEADLTNANLTGSSFKRGSLNNADLTNANLTGSSFDDTSLKNTNLTNAILIETDFRRSDLSKVIIQKIDRISIWNKLYGTHRELKQKDEHNKSLKQAFKAEEYGSGTTYRYNYRPALNILNDLTMQTHFNLKKVSQYGSLKAYTLLKNLNGGPVASGDYLISIERILSDEPQGMTSCTVGVDCDESEQKEFLKNIYVHEYNNDGIFGLSDSDKKLYNLYEYAYDLTLEEKKLLRLLVNYYNHSLHFKRDYHDKGLHEKSRKQLEEYKKSYHQKSVAVSGFRSCVSPVFDYTKISPLKPNGKPLRLNELSSVILIAREQYLDQSQSILEQYDIYEDCLKNSLEKLGSRYEFLADSLIKITYELNIPNIKIVQARENREKSLKEATEEYQKDLLSLLKQISKPEEILNTAMFEMTKQAALAVNLERSSESFALAGGFTPEEKLRFFERKETQLKYNMNRCLVNSFGDDRNPTTRTFILKSLKEFVERENYSDEPFETLTIDFAESIIAARNRCISDSVQKYVGQN